MFEEKVTADAAAWVFNVVSSVAIVFANKVLMDPKWGFKFVFGETDRMHRESVCMGIGYHAQLANGLPSSQQQPCAPCTSSRRQLWSRALSCWDLALGPVCRCMVSLENTVEVCIHMCVSLLSCPDCIYLAPTDKLAFSSVAAMSIVSLNLSLLLNTVGFYQVGGPEQQAHVLRIFPNAPTRACSTSFALLLRVIACYLPVRSASS